MKTRISSRPLFFLIFLFALVPSTQAMDLLGKGSQQSGNPYKAFRVDVNCLTNFSLFTKNRSVGVLTLGIEPKYAITKHLSVGFLASVGAHWNPYKNTPIHITSGVNAGPHTILISPVSILAQYQGTLDFHFLASHALRPYVGVAIGAITDKPLLNVPPFTAVGAQNNRVLFTRVDKKSAHSYFLFSPRAGIDIWHFRFNLVYNIVAQSPRRIQDLQGIVGDGGRVLVGSPRRFLNNLSFQILFYFGGGRK